MQCLQTGAGERDDTEDTDPPRTLTYEPTHGAYYIVELPRHKLVQTRRLAIALPAHIIKLRM